METVVDDRLRDGTATYKMLLYHLLTILGNGILVLTCRQVTYFFSTTYFPSTSSGVNPTWLVSFESQVSGRDAPRLKRVLIKMQMSLLFSFNREARRRRFTLGICLYRADVTKKLTYFGST